VEWNILVGQLVGTLIGCAIGAYITGRWTEAGRINAVTAALAKVVEQETAKAFAQEQGKNLARKEDLNEILAEVRAITITQKEIEAKISGEVWDRETQWKEKRDTYAGLIKVASLLVGTLVKLDHFAGSPEANSLEEERLKHIDELVHYQALTQIFGNAQAVAAFEDFFAARHQPPEGQLLACMGLRETIAQIARHELGIRERG